MHGIFFIYANIIFEIPQVNGGSRALTGDVSKITRSVSKIGKGVFQNSKSGFQTSKYLYIHLCILRNLRDWGNFGSPRPSPKHPTGSATVKSTFSVRTHVLMFRLQYK